MARRLNECQYNTGQIIHDMRRRSGLTRSELGKKMGVSQSAIKTIEGRVNCTFETMADYAYVMGYEIVFRRKTKDE